MPKNMDTSVLDRLPAFIASPLRPMFQYSFRQQVNQYLSLALIVSSALISWKTLMLLTGSESPIVVVLSGSMEPAFYRGDILFLNMGTAPLRTGEVVVYNLADKDIPIVHRIIQVHERADKGPGTDSIEILTKGDNNHRDDRMLYNPGQKWLKQKHVMGRAVGFLPYVGMVTIVMNDYPWLKYSVIGLLGILCLLGLDD